MNDLFKILKKNKITLPDDVHGLFTGCRKITVFDSVEQLAIAAVGGEKNNTYEVKYYITEKGDLNEAAVNLFVALHRLEESDVSRIYAEAVSEIGIGIAIMDRLRKASYQYSL